MFQHSRARITKIDHKHLNSTEEFNGSHIIVGQKINKCRQCIRFPGIFKYSSVTGDLLYKEPLKLFVKVGYKASFCRDIAMIVQKAT